VRAFWNGKIFISKHGKRISSPRWFTRNFPKYSIDGELWLGYGNCEGLTGALHSIDDTIWKNISYIIFDIPDSKDIYEIRMDKLRNLKLPNHVLTIDVIECLGNDHLKEILAATLERGGEGLMINEPKSYYLAKRTSQLLKVKVVLLSSFLLFSLIRIAK
jgi:DNA ligase-1